MAQRRMFSKKITDTDMFLDMPATAQNLYFHLNMHADDDGFLGNAKTIQRMIGANEDDLKLLVAKKFLIMFPDGVTVIRDWRIHNYIRSDRYRSTIYSNHKKQLSVDENQRYQLNGGVKEVVMTSGIPSDIPEGYTGKVKLGKDRLGQDRTGKVRLGKDSITRQDKTRLLEKSSSDDEQPTPDYQSEFEKIWKKYPNKQGKRDAFRHYRTWRKKSKTNTVEFLDNKLDEYIKYVEHRRSTDFPELKYMNGSTWFNGRFEDEYNIATPSNKDKNSRDYWVGGFKE